MTHGNGTVLVVEDDREINQLVGAYAELAGFKYRPALTGTSALDQARRHPPTAVILDLMLPDLDGFEVCRRLRRELALKSIPIIILSALNSERDKALGRECGADEYLTKPFNPDDLLNALHEFTHRQQVN